MCPICKSEEVESLTPRTVYACGSSDYDQRPLSFLKGDKCMEGYKRISGNKTHLCSCCEKLHRRCDEKYTVLFGDCKDRDNVVCCSGFIVDRSPCSTRSNY